MKEYMEIYIAEAKELLDEMNGSLLMLDKNLSDSNLINSIFRDVHTLKGNSASMGFKKMESLSHSMEDVLQDIREGKVEADGKIVELLFVCHDFLENGINTIMQTGNEDEMKIDGVLSRLHNIIGEKHEKLKVQSASDSEKSMEGTELILNNQELYSLKKDISAGFHAYVIQINLSEDCIFKSVRVWMWFTEMESYLKLIKSVPEKPTAEGIKNNSFTYEGSVVKLLAASKNDTDQLLGRLNQLLDTSNITIEPVTLTDTDFMKSQIKLVMMKAAITAPGNNSEIDASENKERLIEIGSEFSIDFINEISVQLSKMEVGFQSLDQKPGNSNAIYKLLRLFHTVHGLAGFINNKVIEELAGSTEKLIEYSRKGAQNAESIKTGLFKTSADLIRKLCADNSLAANNEFNDTVGKHISLMKNEIPIEEPSAENILTADKTPEEIMENDKNPLEGKEYTNKASYEEEKAVNELFYEAEKEIHKTIGKSVDSFFMRVSTRKIDSLVDMLGELIIMHSLILKEASEYIDSNDKYMANLLRMSKIIKEIQNLSMSLRMVSLKQTLQKTMRVGRDTAAEIGKKVNITMKGEETEIDRDIADRLTNPLMHLIRNAVSHGIESIEERTKNGKPMEGQVNILAYSKRGYVYIEVEDDGAGLSIEKIRAKAVEKHLLDPNTDYSTDDIIKLIFLPGFSTKEKVDNISGRGVGMDVVETDVKKVGGKIDIINKPGEGCKFVLKIPLNLAVLNGTIVNICEGRYIIPTIYIKQFLKPEDSQWVKVKDQKTMIRVRDDIYQVIPVNKIFGMDSSADGEDENMVIILEVEQKYKALPVKNVIGRQEIVSKPLDKEFSGLDFVSGASILGDGKVSLILDVESIFEISNN